MESQSSKVSSGSNNLHRVLHPGFEPGTSALGVLRATIAPVELLIFISRKSTIIFFVMQKFHVFRFYLIVDDLLRASQWKKNLLPSQWWRNKSLERRYFKVCFTPKANFASQQPLATMHSSSLHLSLRSNWSYSTVRYGTVSWTAIRFLINLYRTRLT